MQNLKIKDRVIGPGHPIYFIAEMSGNHNQSIDVAIQIIHEAKKAGADAVKVQTADPDSLTVNSNSKYFAVGGGTIWDGRTLYDLYKEVCMPWGWQPILMKEAASLGLHFFSSPFDDRAVDFLETLDVPAYKIASFELVDFPLIEKTAATGKPLIMSTGMATFEEIQEAVTVAKNAGAKEICLLKCTSAYPASLEEMNLLTIPHLTEKLNLPIGLSDHTLDLVTPIAAASLGATVIEKHFTLSRDTKGPDSAFSLEPQEFQKMVETVKNTEKALGKVHYGLSKKDEASRMFRRSLFAVADIEKGEILNLQNIRSIRPAHGLHTKYLGEILGKRARTDIKFGTPLTWEMIEAPNHKTK